MIYSEEQRDLFSVSDDYYLVQCISADLAMGAGIAVQFNKHFNTRENLRRSHYNILSEWDKSLAKGFCIQDGKVFNLVTKRNYYQKPTKKTILNSLVDLRKQVLKQRIRLLAMPKIGSGLDKMNWNLVRNLIKYTFNDINVKIVVCYM